MQDVLSRATDRAYRWFGVAATYEARDGSVLPCVVLAEFDLSRYGGVAQVQAATAVLSVRCAEVPSVPRRGERFVLAGGRVLVVESLQASDGLEHRVFAA